MMFVQRLKLLQNLSSIFLVAFDETNDTFDTSQLAAFIREVNSEMKVTGKFLDLVTLNARVTNINQGYYP